MAKELDLIVNALGEPYWRSGECLIYNEDCVNAMQRLSKTGFAAIDTVITSPPYNIGKSYETIMATEEYVEWSSRWMTECHAISAKNGAFWLNLGYAPVANKGKAVPLSYLLWDKSPYFLLQEVVWNYGAGVACKNSLSPRNEKFLWYVKDIDNYTFNLDSIRDPDVKYPNQRKDGKLRCNPLGKNPSDVWQIPKVTSGYQRSSKERADHPAQFPEALIERIMLASSNKGDLLLDPFMGSGTTAAVAKKLGRSVLGFEKHEPYCAQAAKRVQATLSADMDKK